MGNPVIHTEKELLLQVAKGNEKAFEQLMRLHHIGVYHAAYRLSGDKWMAEEVVQDLFLKVWLKRTILPEIIHFQAWLNTIAENITLNAIKQSLRKKNDVKSWVADFYSEVHGSNTIQEENYLVNILNDAVQQLSPRQRQVYELIKEQGFQREEAAQMMNISSETVKTHLEQALRNIRAYCIARIDSSALLVIAFIEAKKYF